jgi:SulP family sulfate permease
MEKIFLPKTFSVYKRKGYTADQFRADTISGIIVGVLALPLAIAFAIASGVSPEKGLITAVVAGFIISFLGGSRVQIGGPTGAFVVIVVGIVHQYGIEGLLISTVLAGIFLIGFGLLKLGNLIKFFPYSLVVGFTSGIAVIIFTSQIKDFLGLETGVLPTEFLGKWKTYFSVLYTINIWSLLFSASTVLIMVFSKRITRRIPGAFIAIILLTTISALFTPPVATIESVYGTISGRIGPVSLPSIHLSDISMYIAPALTIAMLGAIESLLSAVVSDGMISSVHRSNTELIAQGIANIASALVGGIPATGAIARTATNVRNGGRTPLAGMVHAATLLLIMLFLGRYAGLIPLSVLAGILVVVAYNMSEWRSFIRVVRDAGADLAILLVTFFLTVFFDLTIAIEVGMVLAALLFMQRMSKLSNIYPIDEDQDLAENYSNLPDGLTVYEINGPFFFGAARQFTEVIREVGIRSKVIILRMRHVPFMDSTGLRNFREVIGDLNSKGVTLILSGVQPEVLTALFKSDVDKIIPGDHICPNFDIALEKAYKAMGIER